MTADKPKPMEPSLRFPEFGSELPWHDVALSIASDVNPTHNGLPESFIYIDLESVKSGTLVERKEVKRDNAPSRAQRLLRRKDILYQTVRPYQRNNLLFDIDDGYDYVASTGYAQLRAYGCPKFLYQLLHTSSFVNRVLSKCTGSNYPAINSSDLVDVCVSLPNLAEQQKIADCLGSLDDLIAAADRKLAALRQHKQGLMQQLFPQPGETVPRLRFPEFAHLPAWEHTTLHAAAPFATGRVPVDQVPLADYISTENLVSDFGGVAPATRLPPSGSATRYQPGDVLVANIRPYLRKVWRADRFGGASNDVIVMRPTKDIDPCFFEHVIKNDVFIAYVMRTAKGVKMPRGDLGSIREYAVFRPTRAEQKKIADCLGSLDDLIAAKGREIEYLKTHKKGLLQQLFPNLDTR